MKFLLSNLLMLSIFTMGISLPLVAQTTEKQTQTAQEEVEQLSKLAEQQLEEEKYQEAIATFQKLLDIARKYQSRSQERKILNNIGLAYSDLGQPQKAIEYYNQALLIARKIGDLSGEEIELYNIGLVYRDIGQPQKALEYFYQTLPILQKTKDRAEKANNLNIIGILYQEIGQLEKALEYHNQALLIFREEGDRSEEVSTLNNIGILYQRIGQQQKAIEYFNQALEIAKEEGDRSNEGTLLDNIGTAYQNLAKLDKALEYYNQALLIFKEEGDRSNEGIHLNRIGLVYWAMGQSQKALLYFNQALSIGKEIGEDGLEGVSLNNIGLVYDGNLGKTQKAIEYYNQALPMLREARERLAEGRLLSNIGFAYYRIGQSQKALLYINQALPILRETKDRSREGVALNNIGNIYQYLGESQKALEYFNQALLIAREQSDPSLEGLLLNNIGSVYLYNLEQSEKALEYYNQALPIVRGINDRAGESTILNNIGYVYYNIGQLEKARLYYNQALSILREVDAGLFEKCILINLALIDRDTQRPTEAITKLEESIKIFLEVRQDLLQENRQSYIDSMDDTAIALTDLLIDQNQPQKAFEWINRFTTFELADYNRLIDAKVSNPEARQALEQWNAKQLQLQALQQKVKDQYSPTLVEQIRQLNTEVKTEAETIIKRFPEVAERLETTPEDITRLQANIPEGTVVIQPVLLTNVKRVPNNLALFILSKNKAIQVKKVPVTDPKALEQLIVQYRETLSDRFQAGWRDQGGQLYDYLIRPIESEIQALAPKKIAIIATGKLRYFPFETLWDKQSNQYLIEKYLIHYYTRLSVNALATTKSNPQSIQVLGLGNPIPQAPFNLPDAEQEIKAIPTVFSSSQIYLNSQATRKNLQQFALRFPYLHLATHACFEKEGCCLKEDQCTDGKKDMNPNTILFADEQFNLANLVDLNLSETELVILSACKTALREDSDGNEISGIAYLFEQAGAKSIMASLWSAEDQTTREIMIQFYQHLQQGKNKTEALRQAKLTQINSDRHPFFWSPFILIGNGE